MNRILKLTSTYILILALAASGMAFGAQTDEAESGTTSESAASSEQAESAETDTATGADQSTETEQEKEESEEQQQAAQKKPVKISLDGCTVVLDKYFVRADGEDHTPKVVKVYKEYAVGNHIKDILPEGYTVTYYRYRYVEHASKVVSGEMEQMESCTEPGEYKVVITAKEDGAYKDSCEALFTIAGQPQIITVDKTEYRLNTKAEDFRLEPEATGDGSGFVFSSGNKKVADVSQDGLVHITGCGQTNITILTDGDKLSHPAARTVTVIVEPDKVLWKKTGAVKRTDAGAKALLKYNEAKGATRYEVMYSTSKSFKETATRTKKTKKLQTTIKNLKPDRTYYVKVRAMYEFTDSRGNKRVIYGDWSSVKTLKKGL